ncbi:glycosyltransferase [Microbacterium hominis]|uniref:glycosyltransferase n=1 Tax=Microbacterium hominis TaxID=162426 RepID=UPI0014317D92|nr:glycosyltransferase [Microbacterium hominis]
MAFLRERLPRLIAVTAARDRVRVLMSFGDPSRARNPYTRLLAESLPLDEISPSYFTWRHAFLGRYDMFHVHWPHSLAGPTKGGTGVRNAVLFIMLLGWLAVRRRPIVWTVHNRTPHERLPWLSRVALRLFESRVAFRILLLGREDGVEGVDWEKIPHGHYRDAYGLVLDQPLPEIPRVLHFGLLRPYKNSDQLVEAFVGARDAGAELLVAGKPVPPSYGVQLAEIAGDDPRVDLRLEFVPDEQVPELLATSTLVALPYAEMYNSGAALLALSSNRPVLMPDCEATRELVDEFGDRWVLTFAAPLTPSDLERAIALARTCDGDSVDMAAREWPLIGRRHAEVYRRLVR